MYHVSFNYNQLWIVSYHDQHQLHCIDILFYSLKTDVTEQADFYECILCFILNTYLVAKWEHLDTILRP